MLTVVGAKVATESGTLTVDPGITCKLPGALELLIVYSPGTSAARAERKRM